MKVRILLAEMRFMVFLFVSWQKREVIAVELSFRRLIRPAVLVVALSLAVLGGCGQSQPPSGAGKSVPLQAGKGDPAVVTIADSTGDWGWPSPYGHYLRGPGYVRMTLIFDSLVWKGEKGYGPCLAEKWQWLPDEKAWRLTLRPGVKWHDGKPFTAADVAFTFDYYRKYPYPYVPTTVVTRVEVIGDREIKLYLREPYAPFLDYISSSIPILPKHIWENVDDPKAFKTPQSLVGTGPYRLADYSAEHGSYRFVAVPDHYFGKQKIKEIRFVKLGFDMAVAAVRRGEVDAAQVPPDIADALRNEGLRVIYNEGDWVAKMLINHRQPPLDSREVRQALGYLIDRPALLQTTFRGHGIPGSPGLVPPNSRWANPDVVGLYPYNPQKAAELLQTAGYKQENGVWTKDGQPLKLELLVPAGAVGMTGAPSERQGEFIKNRLAQAGIQVELRAMDAKTVDNRQATWNFQLALTGTGGLGCDPEAFSRLMVRDIYFGARWQGNAELLAVVKKASMEMDLAARKALIMKIQALAAQDLPDLPLYYPRSYWAHNGKVRLWYTFQGIGNGAPIPLNKLCFVGD